jgi:hypothetical protein
MIDVMLQLTWFVVVRLEGSVAVIMPGEACEVHLGSSLVVGGPKEIEEVMVGAVAVVALISFPPLGEGASWQCIHIALVVKGSS